MSEVLRELIFPTDVAAERREGEAGHFEMLASPWQADDGQAEEQTEKEVEQTGDDAAREQPDHIENEREATRGRRIAPHCCPERPKSKQAELESLPSKRQADNGDGQRKTAGEIAESSLKTAENEPKQISDDAHRIQWVVRVRKNE